MWSIYVIRNIATGKLYVGQTVKDPPIKRWKDHLCRCRRGENKRLYDSIRKHGEASFEFTDIERWDAQVDANEAEEFWVSFFRSWDLAFGYNMTRGGECAELSPAVIDRLREINLGERNPFHGQHHTDDAKRRIGEAARNPSARTRKKLSAAGLKHSSEHAATMRAVSEKLWADPAHRTAMTKKRCDAWATKRTTKLTHYDVTMIHERLLRGDKAKDIAADLHVSPSMITAVKQGKYTVREGIRS